MPVDVVDCRAVGGSRFWLRFDDGVAGEVDMAGLEPSCGVFAALAQPEQFARVRVDPNLGTVVWPDGADLDPDVLHARVIGRSIGIAFDRTIIFKSRF